VYSVPPLLALQKNKNKQRSALPTSLQVFNESGPAETLLHSVTCICSSDLRHGLPTHVGLPQLLGQDNQV
jgi:hypothetical protein